MELSGDQLRRFLKKNSPKTHNRVCAYDQFRPGFLYFPICCVVNSEKASIPMGHWVGFYVDKNRKATFVDSFGLEPWGDIAKFLGNHAILTQFSTRKLQNTDWSCGHHVLFVLTQMSKGETLQSILEMYENHRYETHDDMVLDFYERNAPNDVLVQ